MNRAVSTSELRASERSFLSAMQRMGFGRFEFLRIDNKELVLEPWPTSVHGLKFGSKDVAEARPATDEFQLKHQVIEFFDYVRSTETGEIRCLEIRHGLPFSMEIELPGSLPAERGGSGDHDHD